MKPVGFLSLFLVTVCLLQAGQANGQNLIHPSGGMPGAQPVYQPGNPPRAERQFVYGLASSPQAINQAAFEALSHPSNYNQSMVVVGLVRLRGDQRTVRDGAAKLFRLSSPDGRSAPVLLEQKVGLQLIPNEAASIRETPVRFVVVPMGNETTAANLTIQPQAAPMMLVLNPQTVGTSVLEAALYNGGNQMIDARRLQKVQSPEPIPLEPTRGIDPMNGPLQLSVAPQPTGGPPFTNLTVGPPGPVVVPPKPGPLPTRGDGTRVPNGYQMPVQEFLVQPSEQPGSTGQPVIAPGPEPPQNKLGNWAKRRTRG